MACIRLVVVLLGGKLVQISNLHTVLICFDPVFVKVEITTDPLTCEMLFF